MNLRPFRRLLIVALVLAFGLGSLPASQAASTHLLTIKKSMTTGTRYALAVIGNGNDTCTVTSATGLVSTTITLSSTGVGTFAVTPTAPGNYELTINCSTAGKISYTGTVTGNAVTPKPSSSASPSASSSASPNPSASASSTLTAAQKRLLTRPLVAGDTAAPTFYMAGASSVKPNPINVKTGPVAVTLTIVFRDDKNSVTPFSVNLRKWDTVTKTLGPVVYTSPIGARTKSAVLNNRVVDAFEIKLLVPQDLPAGQYWIESKVCDTANNCMTAYQNPASAGLFQNLAVNNS